MSLTLTTRGDHRSGPFIWTMALATLPVMAWPLPTTISVVFLSLSVALSLSSRRRIASGGWLLVSALTTSFMLRTGPSYPGY